MVKAPQIPSNRDHKALNRGTLGGLGRDPLSGMASSFRQETEEMKMLKAMGLPTGFLASAQTSYRQSYG